MLSQLGPWELTIVLIIVLLIFGAGRISKIGRELGTGIREFREGLSGEAVDEGGNKAQGSSSERA